MQRFRLSPLAAYLALAVCAGVAVAGVAVFNGVPTVTTSCALLLLALVLSEVLAEVLVLVPSASTWAITSFGSAFSFALLLSAGTAMAVIGSVVGSVIGDTVRRMPAHALVADTRRRWRDRILINASQAALAWGAAGLVFEVSGGHPDAGVGLLAPATLPAVIACGAVMFVVNYCVINVYVMLERGGVVKEVLAGAWQAATEDIAPLSMGLLIAAAGVRLETIPLLLAPFAAYLGYRKAVSERDRALRDPLTGLVTRTLFLDRAQQAVRLAERTGVGGAILLLDLDGFKHVNDTFGHHAGDAVLKEVARRLTASVRASDTVGRLGGDEFAVLLRDQASFDDTHRLVGKIAAAIEGPIETKDCVCTVGASVGLAPYPDHSVDVDSLLKRADEAMYRSKLAGGHAR